MSYSNPPSSWYDPPEVPDDCDYEDEEDTEEEFDKDDCEERLEFMYQEAVQNDYDRFLNWLYQTRA